MSELTGASMPVLLLLLLLLSQQSPGTVVSGEVIATEILRTLVGSIGLGGGRAGHHVAGRRGGPPAVAFERPVH